jgi:hypothetical protein
MGLGSEIRDPEKTYSGSRIQGSKRHRILDPGSATLGMQCRNVALFSTRRKKIICRPVCI